MSKQLVLSVTKDQFDWQFFRAGGKGGQKQNKTSSACRCTHPPSGAVGVARDERQQVQNRRLAFIRCVNSVEFQTWLKVQTSKQVMTQLQLEALVDKSMREENLRTEYYTPIDS